MCGAVGKSGSPISRWMTFPPASSMARARARTSKADSVPSLVMRAASRMSVMGQLSQAGQGYPEVGLGGGVVRLGQGQPAQRGVRVLRADRLRVLGGHEEAHVGVLVGGLALARGDADDHDLPDRGVRPGRQV